MGAEVKRCSNCEYYKPNKTWGGREGSCRRYPKELKMTSKYCCGEHKECTEKVYKPKAAVAAVGVMPTQPGIGVRRGPGRPPQKGKIVG